MGVVPAGVALAEEPSVCGAGAWYGEVSGDVRAMGPNGGGLYNGKPSNGGLSDVGGVLAGLRGTCAGCALVG